MQTLPTSPAPSPSSSKTTEFKTLSVVFGNGYQQDAPDGINDEIVVWSVVYENISLTQTNAIKAVLKAAKSWDIIVWTDPDGDTRTYKMTDKGYTQNRVANVYSLRFELKSVPSALFEGMPQYVVMNNFTYVPGQSESFQFTIQGQ